MRRVTAADLADARRTPGATILLFLTDRCPVGCNHCSVDSRPDSPMIKDRALFADIVTALCESDYWLIGVSGGEPFIERKGLTYAVDRLTAAGKDVSVVTSGVWAKTSTPPGWIREAIAKCGSLVLSSDAFHSEALPDHQFRNAARSIARENTWIITQVIEVPEMIENARRLLADALGPSWSDYAEMITAPMLPYGRARDLFQITSRSAAAEFGPCRLVRSPVVRYDGVMSVCCNENVIMGKGPRQLRARGDDEQSIKAGMRAIERHAFFRAIGSVGPGPLTADPRLADLEDGRYADICDLCWSMASRVGDCGDDVVFSAVADVIGADIHVA